MKRKQIDKEKLVHSILWEILENEGGHANLTSIWSKYLPRISEINLEYGIDLSQVDWKNVLQKFTYDDKTKDYHLPTTLQPLPKPEDILKGVKVVRVEIEHKDEIHYLKEELNRVRKERNHFLKKNREMDFLSKSSKDFLEVWGTTPQQIQSDLTNYSQYLSGFPRILQPAYFELLIMKAISCILQLPLYPEDVLNKDFRKENTVVWRGKIDNLGKPTSWALGGGPDAIAYAHGFHLLIEASLTSGLGQWTREFAPNIRHLVEYTKINNIPNEDVYMLFVAPDIAVDTFTSLKETSRKGKSTIPLPSAQLVDIVETSRVIIGIPHVEIRRLLDELSMKLNKSPNLEFYKESIVSIIERWQIENMNSQKDVFLALKSYSALISQEKGFARVSEITEQLRKDSEMQSYFDAINDTFDADRIAAILLSNGLAQRIGMIGRDMLLRAVPIIEFKSKTFKMLAAFEKLTS